jgi:hypothetical protein
MCAIATVTDPVYRRVADIELLSVALWRGRCPGARFSWPWANITNRDRYEGTASCTSDQVSLLLALPNEY